MTVHSNFQDFERLKTERLYNFSNDYTPLRFFRLRRVLGRFYKEKTEGEYDLIYKTFWETEDLDHTKNVPCARTGHSVVISKGSDCVYVIGGVTILADEKYRDQRKIPDESWLLYPLRDVWELSLDTSEWRKVLDIGPRFDIVSDWHQITELTNFMFNFSTVYDHHSVGINGSFQQLDQEDSPDTKPMLKMFYVKCSSGSYVEQGLLRGGQTLRTGHRSEVRLDEDWLALGIALEDGEDAEEYFFRNYRTCLTDNTDAPIDIRLMFCFKGEFLDCDFVEYEYPTVYFLC